MMNTVLDVSHLTKSYGTGPKHTLALEDVSFRMLAGEFLGLMGASGSGKTTLLNCLATILEPDSGRIELAGRDLADLHGRELATLRGEAIAYLFQDFALLDNLTGRENIMLPLGIRGVERREIESRLAQLSDWLGIAAVLDKFPVQMSGGEQQRVAAARCLIARPQLILADEPTGALDTRSARSLLELLAVAHREQGRSLLMVTHNPAAAVYCQRILFLRDGRLAHELRRGEEGPEAWYERIQATMAWLGGGSEHVL